jgi:hypothetical protein
VNASHGRRGDFCRVSWHSAEFQWLHAAAVQRKVNGCRVPSSAARVSLLLTDILQQRSSGDATNAVVHNAENRLKPGSFGRKQHLAFHISYPAMHIKWLPSEDC